MEFTGRLGAMSLSDLLQWPHNERRSGSLVVRTARREKRVIFERGLILGCIAGDPSEYFGQHLLLNGYLQRRKLLEALALCRVSGARLGTALVDLGLLSAQECAYALAKHVEERVCDLFIWDHGVFYFLQEMPEVGDRLTEPLDPLALSLEGTRWADEHERIRQVLVHDGVVLRPGGPPPPGDRSPLVKQILASVDRPRRVDELYELVHGSRFRFLEATYQLLVDGTLEVDRLDEVSGASSEIRMFDLMLEQANEEEVLFSPRHLSLPLEWLHRFYPLWVEGEEIEAVRADEMAFYRLMDGSRSLGDLVLTDVPADRREERMDLVLLQLQKGQLALLPRPLAELKALGKGARNPWLRRFMG
ncbi:MAG TPA: DUF4388 domain-containing protein [Thermoanaerobaculia bacterium]|jgi:hypothetical protein|nr:DUF4388 domain-containing protein [Thermoanaerobaculia bacterium]